jgi:hypothetical protein
MDTLSDATLESISEASQLKDTNLSSLSNDVIAQIYMASE